MPSLDSTLFVSIGLDLMPISFLPISASSQPSVFQ